MHIALGVASLCHGKGGTERAATELAHAMLKRGHDVHIFAIDLGKPPAFELDPKIKLHLLSWEFRMGQNEAIAKAARKLEANAIDVFVSMQSQGAHMLWALLCKGAGVPFICSERSDPRYSETATWNKAGRAAVLASSDAIHELLDVHVETVPDIHKHKVAVIPNIAPKTDLRAQPGAKKEEGTILFLARFIPGKRADLLLRAFALLAPEFPGWRLRLAGYGRERAKLFKLVKELGIEKQIDFSFYPKSWQEECSNAQIYCLPTKVEGFPNSVLEAMASGLPVVGIGDCPAMTAIVKNEKTGLLASNATPQALAAPLKKLMLDPDLRKRMGKAALEECDAFYKSDYIFDQWETLLYNTAKCNGHTIMAGFNQEPFASMARLSSAARREYILRDFGQPMPLCPAWFLHKAKNIFRNTIAKPLQKNIRAIRKALVNFQAEDFACIVRSVGERTTNQCVALLEETFAGKAPIKLLQEQPFTEALRQTMLLGMEMGRKWTFVVDADVLVEPAALLKFLALAQLAKRNTFMLHAPVCDKFFMKPRQAGNRLYRTEFMEKALEFVPSEGESYRPESELCNRMQANGYLLYKSNIIIGLHDYEQDYEDIFRKALLFGFKHKKSINQLLDFWKMNQEDQDYAAALDGLNITMNKDEPVIIDKNLVSISADACQFKWKNTAKSAIVPEQLTGVKVSEIIKNDMEDRNVSLPEVFDIMEYKR